MAVRISASLSSVLMPGSATSALASGTRQELVSSCAELHVGALRHVAATASTGVCRRRRRRGNCCTSAAWRRSSLLRRNSPSCAPPGKTDRRGQGPICGRCRPPRRNGRRNHGRERQEVVVTVTTSVTAGACSQIEPDDGTGAGKGSFGTGFCCRPESSWRWKVISTVALMLVVLITRELSRRRRTSQGRKYGWQPCPPLSCT